MNYEAEIMEIVCKCCRGEVVIDLFNEACDDCAGAFFCGDFTAEGHGHALSPAQLEAARPWEPCTTCSDGVPADAPRCGWCKAVRQVTMAPFCGHATSAGCECTEPAPPFNERHAQ